MPKMKTHKATAKRVRVTGSGKLMRKRSGGAHLLAKMSSRQKRRIAMPAAVARVDAKRVKKLISPKGGS
ncbi:50S ribosomal protein L35 [bacterium]|nr:50S ribosomal protein L35 [bacterium]